MVCSGSAFPLALRVSEDCYIACERKHTLSNFDVFGELRSFMFSWFSFFSFFSPWPVERDWCVFCFTTHMNPDCGVLARYLARIIGLWTLCCLPVYSQESAWTVQWRQYKVCSDRLLLSPFKFLCGFFFPLCSSCAFCLQMICTLVCCYQCIGTMKYVFDCFWQIVVLKQMFCCAWRGCEPALWVSVTLWVGLTSSHSLV